jgi:hypothetical protein
MMKLKLIVTAALFMTIVNAGIIGYSMAVADEPEKVSYPATDNKNLTNCHTWQNYLTQKL